MNKYSYAVPLAALLISISGSFGCDRERDTETAGGETTPATEQTPPAAAVAEAHARARLIAEVDSLRPGTTTHLGVTFDIDDGWHLYWEGRNDSGLPIDAKMTVPPGFGLGETQWPAPERLVSPGDILDHIYEDRVTLLLPLHVPTAARPRSRVTFVGELNWIACREMCLVESQRVELSLPVGTPGAPAGPARDEETARLFAEARERLPRPVGPEDGVGFAWGTDRLDIVAKGAAEIAFFPDVNCAELRHPIADGVSTNGRLSLRLETGGTEPISVSGVLEVQRGRGGKAAYYALDLAHGEGS